MKPVIHPEYRPVLFVDSLTGDEWVTRSTRRSAETRTVDGQSMGVVRLDVSSYSHPIWTGQRREMDREGRIDRFRKRFARA